MIRIMKAGKHRMTLVSQINRPDDRWVHSRTDGQMEIYRHCINNKFNGWLYKVNYGDTMAEAKS